MDVSRKYFATDNVLWARFDSTRGRETKRNQLQAKEMHVDDSFVERIISTDHRRERQMSRRCKEEE
jgi:hypothetical protein